MKKSEFIGEEIDDVLDTLDAEDSRVKLLILTWTVNLLFYTIFYLATIVFVFGAMQELGAGGFIDIVAKDVGWSVLKFAPAGATFSTFWGHVYTSLNYDIRKQDRQLNNYDL